jgi:8-hydroxy-5-deazaflavin:NADPH oxidoreductase
MSRKIAIIGGTGAEGFGLGLRLAYAGAVVRIGSRDFEKAQSAAGRIREIVPHAEVAGGLNPDAVADAGIAILTVPLAAQVSMLKSVRGSFHSGTILVDATVPLEAAVGGSAGRPLLLYAGSAAQQAARSVPDTVPVVAAFHSLSADLLADLDHAIDSDILLCGDAAEAKTAVGELIKMLPGARPVDAGPLENARMVENLTALLISLNIRKKARHAGVRITGLVAE